MHDQTITPENRVQIITFNYDMVLEHILDKQFANSELMEGKDWRNYFEILHPHGKCMPLESVVSDVSQLIIKWAEGIHVINQDAVPENIQSARDRAKEIILSAREIYAAGFAFAEPNCKMLGLKKDVLLQAHRIKSSVPLYQRSINVCNFDKNLGLSLAVDKLRHSSLSRGTINVEEQKSLTDKPLGVADWIRMGVLGELPG